MTQHTLQFKKQTQRGFSVIEFVVVLTIFAIMSSVSIFSYNDYRRSIEQTNVAQDIGLTIRQAQVYGISASDGIVGDSNLDDASTAAELFSIGGQIEDITTDRSVRGVMIDSDQNLIVLFEDVNRNFHYDDGDRVIDTRGIASANVDIIGVRLCDTDPQCDNQHEGQVDIVFERPYPEAYISLDGDTGVTYNIASIVVSSGREEDSYVEVTAIGNISVKKY